MHSQDVDKPFFEVSSTDGWNKVGFRLDCLIQAKDGTDRDFFAMGTLSFFGKLLSRKTGLVDSFNRAELEEDHSIELKQCCLKIAALRRFNEHLDRWLKHPAMIDDFFLNEEDPSVCVRIGPDKDFISNAEKPVLSFFYESKRLKTETSFIVDYSCLNLLKESLENFIRVSSADFKK
jgi:hypothetical protein